MKKTGIIVAISITAVTLLSVSIIVFAKTEENKETEIAYTESSENSKVISSIDNVEIPENFKDFEPNPEEDKLKEEVVQKYKKGDLKSLNVANISDIDLSLDEIDAKYEAEEEESNKNDLKAYEILSKYKGSKYARTTFITDYELDLTYMREMVTLIESNTLPKDEADVLHRYVSRRAYWITDENTAKEFEKWMLG